MSVKRTKEQWKFISAPRKRMLMEYNCGLKVGDKIKLKKDIKITSSDAEVTGIIRVSDGVWTVIAGDKNSPETVWLREPSGDIHTWDDYDILDSFSKE